MDRQVASLRAFYGGLIGDRAKVETHGHGFPFLERLLAGGGRLEYGELSDHGLLHKYKLVGLSPGRMDELLRAHVAKECNVCLYFDGGANSVFCLNLDNNRKTDNTVLIPEMELAVAALRDCLAGWGVEPLIVASGRGYHVWGRLERPAENRLLYDLMLRAAAKTAAVLQGRGYRHEKIKFNFYPDVRISNVVSLRLFGSEHAKNRVFSRVLAAGELLDEAASWRCFDDYRLNRTISPAQLAAAHEAAMSAF